MLADFTNPESSQGPVRGSRLQAEEVRQVGQRVPPDAVKHHAGQPGSCQPFLRLLQEANYPELKTDSSQVCNMCKRKKKKEVLKHHMNSTVLLCCAFWA